MLAGVTSETLSRALKVTGRRHAVTPVGQLGVTALVLAGRCGRGGGPLIVQRHCEISLQIHTIQRLNIMHQFKNPFYLQRLDLLQLTFLFGK